MVTQNFCEKAKEILKATSNGKFLSVKESALVRGAMYGFLDEKQLRKFKELHYFVFNEPKPIAVNICGFKSII